MRSDNTPSAGYVNGFCKVAAMHGVDATELARYAFRMHKSAAAGDIFRKLISVTGNSRLGTGDSLKRLANIRKLRALLSPKVDPEKLNWFTRLFTKSRNATAIFKHNPITRDPRPINAGEIYNGGPGHFMPPPLGEENPLTREITRVSPGRVLAALAVPGAAAAGGLGSLKKDSDAELKKKIIAGLVATGALGAGAAGIYALSGK